MFSVSSLFSCAGVSFKVSVETGVEKNVLGIGKKRLLAKAGGLRSHRIGSSADMPVWKKNETVARQDKLLVHLGKRNLPRPL